MSLHLVFDTNILISAALHPGGTCHSSLSLIALGDVIPLIDDRIVEEYQGVLARPKFGFDAALRQAFLNAVLSKAVFVQAVHWKGTLPDPGDRPFLEVALSGNADFLVSGDKKGWPRLPRNSTRLVSPREFLDIYEGR